MRATNNITQRANELRRFVEDNAKKALERDQYRDDQYDYGRPLSKDQDLRKNKVHLTNDFGQETTGLRLDDTYLSVTNARVAASADGEMKSVRIAAEDIYDTSSSVVLRKLPTRPWSKGTTYQASYKTIEGPLGLRARLDEETAVFGRDGKLIHYSVVCR